MGKNKLVFDDSIWEKTEDEQFLYCIKYEMVNSFGAAEDAADLMIMKSRIPAWLKSRQMRDYVLHYDVMYWAKELIENRKTDVDREIMESLRIAT